MTQPIWIKSYPPNCAESLDSPGFAHLPDLVRRSAARFGDRPAFSLCLPNGAGASLSFAQVDRLSDAFAAFLREDLGLKPGERVAVQLPNCLDTPVAVFGIFKAGLVLVNVNPLYTAAEMNQILKDSGARALVLIHLFADKLPQALRDSQVEHVILAKLTDFLPPFKRGLIDFVLRYIKKQVPPCTVPHHRMGEAVNKGLARLDAGLDVRAYTQSLGHPALALLQYTGGTTGVSKGAMLSHGNLLWNMACMYEFGKNGISEGEEVILTALPLYHIFAFTVNLLTFFKVGARNVLIPSPRPIRNLKAAFARFPITWMTGVNTLFAALLSEKWFTENPPRHLKVSVAGGAALHTTVARRWKELLGSDIYEGYGLTEASPVVCFNPLTDKARLGTIGVPIPNTEVRLRLESGAAAGPGEAGELCVRGPQVMQGYWNRPEETAQALAEGWLHTGDVAVMEEDGFLRIVDRLKDMINVSGMKVYPNEVEEAISRLEGVQECAVIGVPSGETGEAVRAYVVPKPGAQLSAEQVREHCKSLLTAYKVPRQVLFRTELPKSNIGKILRKDLRAEALREAAAS